MKCPECGGFGGGKDYFGEWDDCLVCDGSGETTDARVTAWRAEIAAIDEDIDWRMFAERICQ